MFLPGSTPVRTKSGGIDYTSDNSSDPGGLLKLEDLITQLGKPKWQWSTDPGLVQQGKTVFNLPTAQGGCVECHGQKPGQRRLLPTWATQLQDVGTDNREWAMFDVPGRAGWQVDTGVLNGAPILGRAAAEVERQRVLRAGNRGDRNDRAALAQDWQRHREAEEPAGIPIWWRQAFMPKPHA